MVLYSVKAELKLFQHQGQEHKPRAAIRDTDEVNIWLQIFISNLKRKLQWRSSLLKLIKPGDAKSLEA